MQYLASRVGHGLGQLFLLGVERKRRMEAGMKFIRCISILFLVGGISLAGTVWAAGAAKYSGFIDNYSELKPDSDNSGGQSFRKTGVDLGNYDKIMIAPIEIWLAGNSKYKGFSPDDYKKITDGLYQSLVAQLEPTYPVVSRPGKGVLLIRIAITDVYAKKKKRGLLGYTPIGFLAGAATGAYRNITLKDATIEAELLDVETLEQLGILVNKLSISKGSDNKGDKTSWEEISESLTFYAKRFRSRMDAEHRNK